MRDKKRKARGRGRGRGREGKKDIESFALGIVTR